MRSKILVLSVAALLTTSAGVALAPPASGTITAVCAGQGTAVLSQGFLYPLLPWVSTTGTAHTTTVEGAETASFAFNISLGACVPGGSLSATGMVTGYCGFSAGNGVTGDGHAFGFTAIGSLLVLTGGLTGVANAVPSPLVANNSCAQPGSASVFILTGGVAKCDGSTLTSLTTLTTAVPLTPAQNLTTLGTTVSSHTTVKPQSVQVSVHACA